MWSFKRGFSDLGTQYMALQIARAADLADKALAEKAEFISGFIAEMKGQEKGNVAKYLRLIGGHRRTSESHAKEIRQREEHQAELRKHRETAVMEAGDDLADTLIGIDQAIQAGESDLATLRRRGNVLDEPLANATKLANQEMTAVELAQREAICTAAEQEIDSLFSALLGREGPTFDRIAVLSGKIRLLQRMSQGSVAPWHAPISQGLNRLVQLTDLHEPILQMPAAVAPSTPVVPAEEESRFCVKCGSHKEFWDGVLVCAERCQKKEAVA